MSLACLFFTTCVLPIVAASAIVILGVNAYESHKYDQQLKWRKNKR